MRQPLAAALAVLLASGCAYESQYTAPFDGRARAVWQKDNVALHLGGAPVSEPCLDQLRRWSADGKLRLVAGYVPQTRPAPVRELHGSAALQVGFWVPVYYGPPIVPLMPGVPPLLLHPVLFSPSLAIGSAVLSSAGGAAGGSGGVGRLGSGGDLGKGLVVLAVIALIVLPIVDVTVAAATPENDRSSDAIDQVNVFNDLARTGETPCSYGWPQ